MAGIANPGEQVNWLFVDMNSYFASVEQQEQPQLRGKPTAVVTVDVDSTCCIAASYEAKAFGVSTGTQLGDAKKRCPALQVIEARHDLYVKYHNRIKEAVESCLHVSKIVSVDEMECQLMGREREPQPARTLAQQVKKAIRNRVGEYLRCSIGLAPNRLLAKMASNMQKPDGLVMITRNQLPEVLLLLKLRDIPGVGERMELRLRKQGIVTMKQLLDLDMDAMTKLWGGVLGTRYWLKLRGLDFDDPASQKTSIGHQHVLPPELRTREQAAAVGQKLLHKAAVRLRRAKLFTSGMSIFVLFSKGKDEQSGSSYWLHSERPLWEANLGFPACQDTMTLINVFQQAWAQCPKLKPVLVSVALVDLVPEEMQNLSLFGDMYGEWKFNRLAQVMDTVNEKYGSSTLYLGGIHTVRETAPPRIAFQSIPDTNLK
ncbi:MAG: DNA polymerase [Candidatus Angelobacter sp. Gp1-AA117]|nr:MAG: DNA polymerase [Candidatus Angelobacter sp. Gp1-AA117]